MVTTTGALRLMSSVRIASLFAMIIIGFFSGCSSTPGDPLEHINRSTYWFNDELDRKAIKPATDVYVKVVPLDIRIGIGNAFQNLWYPNVIVNDFLQAKWGQGFSDTGRMAVNTTVGIVGFFDVATKWHMPYHDNRFGTTLGKWGIPPGPYLVIPFLGPYTLCDTPGIAVATVTNPLYWLRPGWKVTVPLGALNVVDARSRLDFLVRFRSETALDPYVFTRNAYLQYRDAQIRGSDETAPQDIYDESWEEPSKPSTKPSTTQDFYQ